MTDRAVARTVGVLFIVATIAGIVAAAVAQPVVDAGKDLAALSADETRVASGVLLELVMGLAIVGIVIVIHPVLRRFSERLALGYVVARTIEAGLYLISALGALTLLSLSRDLVAATSVEAARYEGLAGTVVDLRDWGNYVLLAIVFGLSALVLNTALYSSRLVPAWLAGFGLVGAVLYVGAGISGLFGLDPLSTLRVLLVAPLGVQEMVLAVWLIAVGFNPSAGTLVATASVGSSSITVTTRR